MRKQTGQEIPADVVAPICQRDRERVIDRLHVVTATAQRTIERPLQRLPVRFDLKGVSAGQFCFGPRGLWYRFNPWVFAVDFPFHLGETVTHEVAHYVTYVSHGHRHFRPHGREWRTVMAQLGFPQARAQGEYSVAGVPRRRQTRYCYRCRCGPHLLTATRHRRTCEGGVYVCRRCNQPLQYAGD